MKQYKIYTSPLGKVEAVKQGGSWPAFFFSFIWACVKGMWALGIGIFVALFVVGLIFEFSGTDETASNGIINLATIVVATVFGAQGNAWREKNLLSRGFSMAATVSAANPEGALALHASSAQ